MKVTVLIEVLKIDMTKEEVADHVAKIVGLDMGVSVTSNGMKIHHTEIGQLNDDKHVRVLIPNEHFMKEGEDGEQ